MQGADSFNVVVVFIFFINLILFYESDDFSLMKNKCGNKDDMRESNLALRK
jgi:hypothetical protein